MLTPEEATPRAIALLTMAHEVYSTTDAADLSPVPMFTDEEAAAVLADDSGEIDWKAIAIAMGMIGHVLLDTIPTILYDTSEETLTEMLSEHFGVPADKVVVNLTNRITGTALLQTVARHVMEMNTDPDGA